MESDVFVSSIDFENLIKSLTIVNINLYRIRFSSLMNRINSTKMHAEKQMSELDDNDDGINAYITSSYTSLHTAVVHQDIGYIKKLLHYGANPAHTTSEGFDCLAIAVLTRSPKLIKFFVECGLSINKPIKQKIKSEKSKTTSLLHLACENSSFQIAKLLLELKAYVNQRDSNENTPLHIAVSVGARNIVPLLIKYGARLNVQNNNKITPLYYAMMYGHKSSVLTLLQHGAINVDNQDNEGKSLFHYVMETYYDYSGSRRARENGTGIDYKKLTKKPVANQKSMIEINKWTMDVLVRHKANLNLKDEKGRTPLHLAVEHSVHDNICEWLIRHGADVNAKDKWNLTPLHLAASYDCPSTVELLLRYGSDVNARDKYKQTALHCAAKLNSVSVLKNLLACDKIDLNPVDVMGETPLYMSLYEDFPVDSPNDIARHVFFQLLRKGANVRTRVHTTGETPLHHAVSKGDTRKIKSLIIYGADVDATDNIHQATPLSIAIADKYNEGIDLLLAYGAEISKVKNLVVSENLKQILIRHYSRLYIAGMYVHPRYKKYLIASDRFKKECKKELKLLKSSHTVGHKFKFSYFHLLHGTRRSFIKFAVHDDLYTAFLFFNRGKQIITEQFPIYGEMIERNYYIGVRYRYVLDKAFKKFVDTFKMPIVTTDQIFDYLDYDDMNNFVRATTCK